MNNFEHMTFVMELVEVVVMQVDLNNKARSQMVINTEAVNMVYIN
jgi:hypothetical protein